MSRNISILLMLICLAPVATEAQSQIGAFTVSKTTDPLTDQDESFIYTDGSEKGRRQLALAWHCLGNRLGVIVMGGGYMGGNRGNQVAVQYRFDKEPASKVEPWTLSSSKKQVELPAEQVVFFTRQAKQSQQVILRITDPLDGETRTETFNLFGISRALLQLPCVGVGLRQP